VVSPELGHWRFGGVVVVSRVGELVCESVGMRLVWVEGIFGMLGLRDNGGSLGCMMLTMSAVMLVGSWYRWRTAMSI
jgi:hypothetical protein